MGSVKDIDIWKLRSDVLVEGVNAELGESTVTVSWVDTTTNASIEETLDILVLS